MSLLFSFSIPIIPRGGEPAYDFGYMGKIPLSARLVFSVYDLILRRVFPSALGILTIKPAVDGVWLIVARPFGACDMMPVPSIPDPPSTLTNVLYPPCSVCSVGSGLWPHLLFACSIFGSLLPCPGSFRRFLDWSLFCCFFLPLDEPNPLISVLAIALASGFLFL